MLEALQVIIERDTYDSILYSVLGGLLLLSIYHLILFLQNQDGSYLLYSLYTFFSFLAYVPVAERGFLLDFAQWLNFDLYSKQFFTVIFNGLYFLFFTRFLHIKRSHPGWFRIIVYPIAVSMSVVSVSYILLKLNLNTNLFKNLNSIFLYVITAQTLVSFYFLLKLKNRLKWYIILGGLILFLSSVLGVNEVRNSSFLLISRKTGDFIYFAGLLFENMAFSFALGHRQRNIYREKVAYGKNFILEMSKNQELKDKINQQNEIRLSAINEKMKWEQEVSELKLAILQSQMNPHFIFNALNSIKFYILKSDTKNAVHYLTQFSKMIRTILTSSAQKEFTLEEELKTLQIYVDIENLRFDHGINFIISVDDKINAEELKLPPMVLQPFIENAILHGITSVDDKKIEVQITLKNDIVEIRISDNGIGRKEAEKNKIRNRKKGKSYGTEIAAGMLRNFFWPRPFSITYHDLTEKDAPAGTAVVIQIPAQLNSHHVPVA